MKTPRFTVGSVTGFAEKQETSSREVTVWYVYDSAYCFHIVREFRGVDAERRAHVFADSLNAGKELVEAHRVSGKTHCKRGHPFDVENTYVAKTGVRKCKKCRSLKQAEWRARRRAAA